MALYLAAWALAVAGLAAGAGMSPAEPAMILAIVGLGFSAVAWLSTRHVLPATPRPPVTRGHLVAVAGLVLYITAYLTWGRGWLGGAVAGEDSMLGAVLDLAEKLLMFVAIPVLVFRLGFGFGPRELGLPAWGSPLKGGRWKPVLTVGGTFVVFQALVGQGARPIMHGEFSTLTLAVGLPIVLAWLVLEVGLVEELFFRGIVQDRLGAALRNGWGGIVATALLFGLAHAPGLWLRGAGAVDSIGGEPSLMISVAYSVAVVSVAGLFLGLLWERTRSLPVVVLVHALGDLLPAAPALLRSAGVGG